MSERVKGWLGWIGGRLESLPLYVLLVIGALIVVGTGTGGYYAYKTYDYIEHDNEFCFSCHLMQEPYELFAQSAHRGLGCKACHQPNMIERSSMGVTAIVENPDSISVHSNVPNDLCADCHIRGDPERWTLIANSAGHKVHLESQDSTLQGLQCVECHSSSLHQFAAADETCAQSGCHTDSGIELGAMSNLVIHCAACHEFSAPVPDVDQAGALAALAPDQDTCLSCHAMRQLVAMPDPDPHENACAACHNPHEQSTPAEAAQTCASSDCHTEPVDLSPFHQGLEEAVIADCMYCHQAHDFDIDGENCLACHTRIMDDDPSVSGPLASTSGSTAHPVMGRRVPSGPPSPGVRMIVAEYVASGMTTQSRVSGLVHSQASAPPLPSGPRSPEPDAPTLEPGVGLLHSWGYPVQQLQETPEFLHSEHPSVDCAECHESVEVHGRVTVTTVADCRSCHHTGQRVRPGGCAECHQESGSMRDPYALTRTMAFSTGLTVDRSLPFDHDAHPDLDCATCHSAGLALSASAVDCASCHEDHHEPEANCMSCHLTTGEEAHVIETAHVTCSGSGCHAETPFEGLPRTNAVCLVCHQDMVDHRPEGECAECHALSELGS
ncbi:MAG: NapC/NirT family cytochrome c [Longimicrobiales bacterium]|nr:NapC/NirT family cytochrome c [Longimicrobiales bacterium]